MPRAERGRRCGWALAGAVALTTLLAGPGGGTLAAFTDYDVATASARAGVWRPDPPAACGPLEDYAGIVWGTPGKDVFVGDSEPRIYLGLGGDDELSSSIAADCLVGGPGRDILVGNATSVLVGDAADAVVWQPEPEVVPPGPAEAGSGSESESGSAPDPATNSGAPRDPAPDPRPEPGSGDRPAPAPVTPPPAAADPEPAVEPSPGPAAEPVQPADPGAP